MTGAEEEDDPFPVDVSLFADTFSQETVYSLVGQELKIRQVFGANLGVAAPVWEAVGLNFVFSSPKLQRAVLFVGPVSSPCGVCLLTCRHYSCAATLRSSRWSFRGSAS